MDENNSFISKLSGDISIRKTIEFEEFLKLLKLGKVETLHAVADALGVSTRTLIDWKRHPRAVEAIVQGVEHAIGEMERVGKNDWRMWAEKLKIIGVKASDSKTQVGVGVNVNLQGGEDEPSIVRRIVGIIEEIRAGAESESRTGSIESGEIVGPTESGAGEERPVVLSDGAGVDAGRTQQGEPGTEVSAEGVSAGLVGSVPDGTPVVDRKE